MTPSGFDVPESPEKLVMIECKNLGVDFNHIVKSLEKDLVLLVPNLSPIQADQVIRGVAESLGLHEGLELHAGLASFLGHRHNIGKYFMSVNKRSDYQFVTPHSEGSSFIGMQLASFFCYENSTNGGETILMKADDSGKGWERVRERLARARLKEGRTLARQEIMQAKGLYQLNLPADLLRDDDQVLAEHETKIAGLTVLDVLAKPTKTYSRVLNRKVNVYWDSVDGADFDSVGQFERMLRQSRLLREPSRGLELCQMDSDAKRRIWHSGVEYSNLFECKIMRKLAPGDLLIQNNLTWTHAVSNWSPDSGTRKVVAAFA